MSKVAKMSKLYQLEIQYKIRFHKFASKRNLLEQHAWSNGSVNKFSDKFLFHFNGSKNSNSSVLHLTLN
ncbi:hypothetical protein BLOT_012625 [Blomia tropicalis]|nr:hypothetical protein BLOT_012625 [Blomia tropicalis]